MINKINVEKLIQIRTEKFGQIQNICADCAQKFYNELDKQNVRDRIESALISALSSNNAGFLVEIMYKNTGKTHTFIVTAENGKIVLLPDTVITSDDTIAGFTNIMKDNIATVFTEFLENILDEEYFNIDKMTKDMSWSISLNNKFFDRVNAATEMSEEETEKWLKEE